MGKLERFQTPLPNLPALFSSFFRRREELLGHPRGEIYNLTVKKEFANLLKHELGEHKSHELSGRDDYIFAAIKSCLPTREKAVLNAIAFSNEPRLAQFVVDGLRHPDKGVRTEAVSAITNITNLNEKALPSIPVFRRALWLEGKSLETTYLLMKNNKINPKHMGRTKEELKLRAANLAHLLVFFGKLAPHSQEALPILKQLQKNEAIKSEEIPGQKGLSKLVAIAINQIEKHTKTK